MHFGVTRPMFNKVIWVQGDDLVETWNWGWFLINFFAGLIKDHSRCQMMMIITTTTIIIMVMMIIIIISNAYIVLFSSKYDQELITVIKLYINNLIKRWFSLSMKMKFKQVFYWSVHQHCSNAAHHFQLASIAYWSSVCSSVV